MRSRPHGHVAAVVGTARKLGFEQLLDRKRSRNRSLATAVVLARVLDPDSPLAAAQGLIREMLTDTLAEELEVEDADADELHVALDWLLARQLGIERRLGLRHLDEGSPSLPSQARPHAFPCRLAHYVEWHMRRALAPMVVDQNSAAAAAPDGPRSTPGEPPVYSFRTLLHDLATLTRNRIQPAGAVPTDILAQPTPVQDRAFRLLGVTP